MVLLATTLLTKFISRSLSFGLCLLSILIVYMSLSAERVIEEMMEEEPEIFLQDLRHELTYFQRTKVLTLLDIYRIQRNLLPILDIWLSSQNLEYDNLLRFNENLLLHALRCTSNLSDLALMVNENKCTLRHGMKTLIKTLPDVN